MKSRTTRFAAIAAASLLSASVLAQARSAGDETVHGGMMAVYGCV